MNIDLANLGLIGRENKEFLFQMYFVVYKYL